MTVSSLFIAIGTLTAHLIYIPVGVSRIFPIQHLINVMSAVLLGPIYAVVNAFSISLLRNLFGTGSPLAFPGSMIGALLAGLFYMWLRNKKFAVLGEVMGTGLIGALVSVPIANFLLGQKAAAFVFIVPFTLSTVTGSIIAYLVLKALESHEVFKNYMNKGVSR